MHARVIAGVAPVRSPRMVLLLLVSMVVAALLVVAAQPALAHESREVGPFTFTVGWIDEPAYAGLPNAVSIRIRDTETEEPFEDLEGLEVDVTYGDETMTSGLRPQFGEPGHYKTDVVPTRPGTWEFRFHGTVGDLEVDETFTSGPDTFNDLQELGSVSFPAADPSTTELAERMDRELARMEERLGDVDESHDETTDDEEATDDEPEAAASDNEAASADSSDGVARTTGIVALILGAAGVLLGLRRRTS